MHVGVHHARTQHTWALRGAFRADNRVGEEGWGHPFRGGGPPQSFLRALVLTPAGAWDSSLPQAEPASRRRSLASLRPPKIDVRIKHARGPEQSILGRHRGRGGGGAPIPW